MIAEQGMSTVGPAADSSVTEKRSEREPAAEIAAVGIAQEGRGVIEGGGAEGIAG